MAVGTGGQSSIWPTGRRIVQHVSPAGAAVAGPVDATTARLYGVEGVNAGGIASAYLRAREADPRASYGDFAAVSRPVDTELADVVARVVCDGIIAPGYEPGTVERLRRKKAGRFVMLEADESFEPPAYEVRDVFGMRLIQHHDVPICRALLENVANGRALPESARRDLLLGLAVARYTQSNSVCFVRDGVTVGVGAGQQSRIDCTRPAGRKTDVWWLRRHPMVSELAFLPTVRRQDRINWQVRLAEGDLTADETGRLSRALAAPMPCMSEEERVAWLAQLGDVAFVSDGALPFRDNVDEAHRHGVRYIAEPGDSIRSSDVADACREHGIVLVRTGVRLFRH